MVTGPAGPAAILRDARKSALLRMRSEFRFTLSGPGDKIGRKSRLDIVGDHLGGAIFRIAKPARPGKPLGLPRNVIGHTGRSAAGDGRLTSLAFRHRGVHVEATTPAIPPAPPDVQPSRYP